jgi:hypothetical protein
MKHIPPVRYLLHRVCAHPACICWFLGTLAIWIPMTIHFNFAAVFDALFGKWWQIFRLCVFYATTSGLGFFFGGTVFCWTVYPLCRRVNGAPHAVGDRVTVLCGRYTGTIAHVYELTRGQGGQLLPRVDLGPAVREKFKDIFDDFCILRTPPLNPSPTTPTST